MNAVFDDLPLPLREPDGEYDCGTGAFMLLYRNSDSAQFGECADALENAGFSLYDRREVCGAVHSHYVRGGLTVQLYHTPTDSSLRFVADPSTALYQREPTAPGGEAVLWQFEVDHSLIDCGMCYIIRTACGRFFIIDSAHSYSVNDNDRLYAFLRERTPTGEKIVIEGWFFSHGHADHIDKFKDFLRFNMLDVEIHGLYYNFVPNDHRDNGFWLEADKNSTQSFLELVEEQPIARVKLHTGQHFCIDNLEFDVLCTHEDVYPDSLENYNDSSTVIRMTANGSVVLFPGDAGGRESDILTSRYGDFLKCDVLQAAHHGHFGTSAEFYRLAEAPLLLFPTTQIKFDEEFAVYEANRVAVELAGECHIASNGTVEIPLPYRPGTVRCLPDETFEDFEGIYNLWAYEYTEQRKSELYQAYLSRRKEPH